MAICIIISIITMSAIITQTLWSITDLITVKIQKNQTPMEGESYHDILR
jgi:hypothetical protein